jgi:Ca-activated chloride channel homolog
MTFHDPVLLVACLIVVAALGLAAARAARRRAAALAAAGIAPARAGRARLSGTWFTIAGLAVLAVAAAGPAATIPVSRANGTVIIAMDVSGSMAATDVAPSRLGAAKQAAQAFISAQPDSVEIGVIAFEEGGLETAVPSADHSAASAAVAKLTATGGTSLGAAILAALSAITHRAVTIGANGAAPSIGYWPSATIVLFSDGQDGGAGDSTGNSSTGNSSTGNSSTGNSSTGNSSTGNSSTGNSGTGDGTDTSAAATVAENAGVHIDTVGVGTTAGTTVDVDGYHLFTALDEATLKSISQATGGAYHPASDASELDAIARSINLRLTVTNQPLPLAGAFIGLALLLLAAGAVLTIGRTGRVV